MSTAPEVVVARQCGMRCFSLAVVTNICVMDDDDTSKEQTRLDHSSDDTVDTGAQSILEEVLRVGLQQVKNGQLLFLGIITEIGTTLTLKMGHE